MPSKGASPSNLDRESALRSAGRVLTRLHRPELARSALQKAIAVNPWPSDYRLALASACYQSGDWPGAVAACREAIRLNPELFEARSLLVQCYLRSREPEQGRRRVPGPAPLLPRQPRGLAAVVPRAETDSPKWRGLRHDWRALNGVIC